MSSQPPRAKGQKAGRTHAIHVEVTEDRDGLAALYGRLDPVGHLAHAGDEEGVEPVALYRGRQEEPCLLDVTYAARDEGARHDGHDAAGLDDGPLRAGIAPKELPTPAVEEPRH